MVIATISRKEIVFTEVSTFFSRKIKSTFKTTWGESLIDSIREIKSRLKIAKIRIIVDESLSYNSVLKISDNSDLGSDIRSEVYKWISSNVPESLSMSDWDYKIVSKDKESIGVVVFAPVQSFFKDFVNAVNENGIKIEAVEPITESVKRNPNPVIGMALKRDIKGKDGHVLNIIANNYVEKKIEIGEIQKTSKVNKSYIFALVFVIILAGLILPKKIMKTDILPTPVTESASTPLPTPEPGAKEEALDLSSYKLEILNGSGVAGEAKAVQEVLRAEGFSNFELANATSSAFTETVIEVKESVPEKVFLNIERALNSDYTIKKSDTPLTENSAYDVIITIGEKNEK